MNYKLIKEYPGSYKLGKTIDGNSITAKVGKYGEHPEFWELMNGEVGLLKK